MFGSSIKTVPVNTNNKGSTVSIKEKHLIEYLKNTSGLDLIC